MPLQDFKDFSTLSEWHANGVLSNSVVLPGQINTPLTDVSMYSSLVVYFQNSDPATYVRLDAIWESFVLAGNDIPFQSIAVAPNSSGRWRIPVLENVISFQSIDLAGPGGHLFEVTVTGTTAHADEYETFGSEDVLYQASSVVAANSALTIGPFPWYNGRVYVTAQADGSGPGFIEFQQYSYVANAWKKFGALPFTNLFTPMAQPFAFPRAPVRAVINNGATAQTIEVFVVASP